MSGLFCCSCNINFKLLAVMAGLGSLCAMSATATTSSIINDQSEWQAISSNDGVNSLTNINLTTAIYSDTYLPHPTGGDALTRSMFAPFEVTFDNQCVLCVEDSNPLVSGGSLSSLVAQRNALIIAFGEPIYGFGGIFDVPDNSKPNADGLVMATVGGIILPGFDGFTSDTAFTQVYLFSDGCADGQSPGCGATISISNMQVSTVPTPEPTSAVLLCLSAPLLFVICRFSSR